MTTRLEQMMRAYVAALPAFAELAREVPDVAAPDARPVVRQAAATPLKRAAPMPASTHDRLHLPTWMTEQEVAGHWGVSVFTVQRKRKQGLLKAKKIGGQWKYRDDWVRGYEDQEDTICTTATASLESAATSSASGPTATNGAHVTLTPTLGRHDAHRLAQATFKKPKSDSPHT